MVIQTAQHIRGATVHGASDCVSGRARAVSLRGRYLPVDRSGVHVTWQPCVKCGARLVVELAKASTEQAGSWLLATHPTSPDARSWQLAQRPRTAELLHAVAQARSAAVAIGTRPEDAGSSLARDDAHDGGDGDVTVVGLFPDDMVAVLDRLLIARPLPPRALAQHLSNPAGFAATAAVFARIASSLPAGTHVNTDPGQRERWAEEHWTAAEAIAAPAAT